MKVKILVGIELGIENLRLIELESVPKEILRLRYYKEIPIPMLTLPGGERTKERVVDWEILISKLKEEFKSRNYIHTQVLVSIAIPQKEANTVLITIPPVKGKDLIPILRREVKKAVTLEEGVDYRYGYLKLGEQILKEGRFQNILAVFAEREKLINYFNNFLSTGIKPVVLTVRSFALYSLITNLYPELSDATIVDIGEDITSIVILKNRQLKFVRSMYISFGNLVELVSKSLGLSLKEVKDFINQYGFDFDSYPSVSEAQRYRNSILNFLGRFRAELQRSLFYYQEKLGVGERPSKIYLTGTALKIKGLEKIFKEILKLDIEVLPFSKILKLESGTEGFKEQHFLFSSCVGCAFVPALREKINLVPKIQKEKIGKKVYFGIFILFLVIYGFIYYNYLGYRKKFSSLKTKLQNLQSEVRKFPPDLEQRYKEIINKRKDFSKLKETFIELQKPYLDWENFLTEFARAVGPEVLIIGLRVNFDENGAMVSQIEGEYRGTFPDAQLTLRKIRLAMEESKFFRDVNFDIQRLGEVKIGEKSNFPFTIYANIEEGVLKKKKL